MTAASREIELHQQTEAGYPAQKKPDRAFHQWTAASGLAKSAFSRRAVITAALSSRGRNFQPRMIRELANITGAASRPDQR